MDIKTEVEGIYRTDDGYLINKDNESLRIYKANKAKMAKMNNVVNDVEQLKQDMAEIKDLLKKALTK